MLPRAVTMQRYSEGTKNLLAASLVHQNIHLLDTKAYGASGHRQRGQTDNI